MPGGHIASSILPMILVSPRLSIDWKGSGSFAVLLWPLGGMIHGLDRAEHCRTRSRISLRAWSSLLNWDWTVCRSMFIVQVLGHWLAHRIDNLPYVVVPSDE